MNRNNRNGRRRGRVTRKRPVGRGVMYGRRSQNKRKQENSFAYQVDVAMKRARDVNVPLAVNPTLVAEAERTGACNIGDLYLDDGVSGSELSRPGLDKLLAELKADRTISHVFIHKRDRLARPHRTSEGSDLEEQILDLGVTIVFENEIVEPRRPGEDDTVEVVTRNIEYSRSGRYSYELSDRVLKTAKVIAADGYRLGGPAPYGFVPSSSMPTAKRSRSCRRGRKWISRAAACGSSPSTGKRSACGSGLSSRPRRGSGVARSPTG